MAQQNTNNQAVNTMGPIEFLNFLVNRGINRGEGEVKQKPVRPEPEMVEGPQQRVIGPFELIKGLVGGAGKAINTVGNVARNIPRGTAMAVRRARETPLVQGIEADAKGLYDELLGAPGRQAEPPDTTPTALPAEAASRGVALPTMTPDVVAEAQRQAAPPTRDYAGELAELARPRALTEAEAPTTAKGRPFINRLGESFRNFLAYGQGYTRPQLEMQQAQLARERAGEYNPLQQTQAAALGQAAVGQEATRGALSEIEQQKIANTQLANQENARRMLETFGGAVGGQAGVSQMLQKMMDMGIDPNTIDVDAMNQLLMMNTPGGAAQQNAQLMQLLMQSMPQYGQEPAIRPPQ